MMDDFLFLQDELRMTKLGLCIGPPVARAGDLWTICNLKANVCLYSLKLFTFRWNQQGELAFICSFPLIWAFPPLLSLSAVIRGLFFSSGDQRLAALVCAKKGPHKGRGGWVGGFYYVVSFFTHLCNYPFLYVIGHTAFIISALWMLQRKATFTLRCNTFLVPRCHFRPDLCCIIHPELPHYPDSPGAYQCTSAPVDH